MIETYYCSSCKRSTSEDTVSISIENITYDVDRDEVHATAHMHCPHCNKLLIGCLEIIDGKC